MTINIIVTTSDNDGTNSVNITKDDDGTNYIFREHVLGMMEQAIRGLGFELPNATLAELVARAYREQLEEGRN